MRTFKVFNNQFLGWFVVKLNHLKASKGVKESWGIRNRKGLLSVY